MKFKDFFDSVFNSRFNDESTDRNYNREDQWSPTHNDENDDFNQEGSHFFFSDPYNRDGFDNLFTTMEKMMGSFNRNMNSFPALPYQDEGNYHQENNSTGKPKRSLRDQILKNPSHEDHTPSLRRENSQIPSHPGTSRDLDSLFSDFFSAQSFSPFFQNGPPAIQEDTDLDADVGEKGLESILDKDNGVGRGSTFSPMPQFHGRQETRSTIRRSDGSSETRITKKDFHGNEEITVITETPDGSRHTVTERKNSDGSTQENSQSFGGQEHSNDLYNPKPFSLFNNLFKMFTK